MNNVQKLLCGDARTTVKANKDIVASGVINKPGTLVEIRISNGDRRC